jgi:hypothetical protein
MLDNSAGRFLTIQQQGFRILIFLQHTGTFIKGNQEEAALGRSKGG